MAKRELVDATPSNAARCCLKMAKLEGDETNANSQMQDLQMLQDAARRRNATSWLQVLDTTVRAC